MKKALLLTLALIAAGCSEPIQRIRTMTKLTLVAAIAMVLAVPLSLSAQNPLVQSLKSVFDITKTNIMAPAEILDDEMYTFRPRKRRGGSKRRSREL